MVYVDRRQRYAIQNALRPFERALIDFYEIQWHMLHRVPTVEEVTKHLRKKFPKLHQTTVNYALSRYPVKKALKDRGIKWEQHTQEELTGDQKAAALTVMNMLDTRSIPDKLDALGITTSQYYAWLNDPVFKNFLDGLAEANKINVRPQALAELTKKINEGDWQAIKFYLEATGEFSQDGTPDTEFLLRAFVEVIQRHVKDPVTIAAIATDLKQATQNRSLEVQQPQQIEGYAVPAVFEEDVLNARKQLGV